MTIKVLRPERLMKIKDVLDKSWTTTQLKTRAAQADRLEYLIDTSSNDLDFYDRAWLDFPVWTLAFLDDDYGRPMFLAKWQAEFADIIERKQYIWGLTSRKAGKSTLLAAKMVHFMTGPARHRISGFAPTHSQDFVYDRARQFMVRSPYLFTRFVKNENADQIDALNGSAYINRSISMTTKGSTARGEYGDIVYLDEIQEIERGIINTVIFPIVADAYSSKRIIMIGTPNLRKNPDLEAMWKGWEAKGRTTDNYASFRVDCWRAIEEGCLNKDYVLEQKDGPKALTPDEFRMEYEAEFPDTSARWFPMNLLTKARYGKSFYNKPKPNRVYAMAVDWAKYYNKTEILVGEVDVSVPLMTYCYWQEFNPKVEIVDYERQLNEVKRIFWQFDCAWICPDTTTTQDVLIDMLFKGDELYRPIPKSAVYTEEPDDRPRTEVKRWGYKASVARNYEMWRNHKQQMTAGRIRTPTIGVMEERFITIFEKEHHELQAVPMLNSQYYRLEEQAGGSKDLAVTAAMLSLFLERFDKTPPSMYIAKW